MGKWKDEKGRQGEGTKGRRGREESSLHLFTPTVQNHNQRPVLSAMLNFELSHGICEFPRNFYVLAKFGSGR